MNSQPIPTADTKVDFADWLSPILVKELRQGLRTKVFTGTFLVVQLLLIGCVLIGLLVAAHGGDTSASTGFFWALVGLPLLFVLPWSGLNAVSAEVRANTLDLIFLTKLSAWRILMGKWIAIVAQSALLLAAVLPYVVLRYFMGGVDLASELMVSGLILAASAVMSATFVGLSAYPSRLMRIGAVVVLLFSMQVVLPMIAMAMIGSMPGAFSTSGIGKWGFVAIGGIVILLAMLMLEFGAARIAPVAENHALRKRVIGAAILLMAVLAWMIDPHSELVGGMAFGVVLPILIGALCEEPALTSSSLYCPFARHGRKGRLLGRFLYPGWPSGLLYGVVILGGFAGLCHAYAAFEKWWFPATFLAFCGALFLPVALTRLIAPATRRGLAIFIVFQIAAVLLAASVRIVDEVTDINVAQWLAFVPTCGLVALMTGGVEELNGKMVAWIEGIVVFVSIVLLLLASKKPWQKISALENKSIVPPASHDRVA